MNYYPRHLGDYAKDAGHLSMLEHGAYTLLLDRFYITEKPIPADQAHRVCRARTKEEKEAVETVLAEFWTLTPSGWTNGRACEEIEKLRRLQEVAHKNGRKGGRPRKNPTPPRGGGAPVPEGDPRGDPGGTQEKPSGFPLGNPPGTQAGAQTKALQTPNTKHQTPNTNSSPPATATVVGREGQNPPLGDAREPEGGPLHGPQHGPPDPAITAGAAVTRALRHAGIANANPGHPRLLALLEAGATQAEFLAFADKAADRRDPFAYVLGCVEGERERAFAIAEQGHQGPLPPRAATAPEPAWVTERKARMAAFIAPILGPTGCDREPDAPDNVIDLEVPRARLSLG